MSTPIYKSLTFWSLIAGLAAFAAKYYAPAFPLAGDQILALLIFLLGLAGVVPAVREQGLTALPVYKSADFWKMAVGLAYFIVRYYAPDFPLSEEILFGVVIYLLAFFDIKPELKARGLLKKSKK